MAQRALGRVFPRQAPGQILSPGVSSRAFSESSRCSKEPVPEFSPTSSPELDAVLAKFRNDLFIPSSLGPRHKRLISKKKHAEQLLNQRVMVNVKGSDEQIRLKPTSITERPTKQDFKTAVKSMNTNSDWRNLVPLLLGLKESKRALRPHQLQWLVRNACEAGKHGIILECARMSARTGLELRDVEVVRALYQGFHTVAQKSNFGEKVVEKTLKQAKQAAFLVSLPDKKHATLQSDPRTQPDIIGVLLELSASRAVHSFNKKDKQGEVVSYASRVLDTWPAGNFDVKKTESWFFANEQLKQMMPLWNGMKLALQVKDVAGKQRADLQKRLSELEPKIKSAMEIVSKANRSYAPASFTMSKNLYKK